MKKQPDIFSGKTWNNEQILAIIPDPQVNNAPTSIWPHSFHKRLIISGIFFIISPPEDLEFF